MGHTNSTVNYNLPQFVGTDKPSWLGDVNGAFLAIDTAIAAAKTQADSAAGGVASLQTTVGSHTTQIGTLTDTVTAQGGTLNSVTALIGNGTPTTTDQTIIGAINEINATVTANSFGTPVDLTQYDTDNPYEAPADGYIRTFVNGAGQTVNASARSSQGALSVGITAAYSGDTDMRSMFVKKGMFLFGSVTGSATCLYFPFE